MSPAERSPQPLPAPRAAVPLRLVAAAAAVLAAFAPRPALAGDDTWPAATRFGTPLSHTSTRCGDPRGVSLYAFPEHPIEGGPVRFVGVSEYPRDATLIIEGPDGERVAQSSERKGGPPYSWYLEVPLARPGSYHARLAVSGDAQACASADVDAEGPPLRPRSSQSLWPVERAWDRDTENLYSAWVERLFDASPDDLPSWKSLHAVTRDPSRNFLQDSLGLGEDSEGGITLQPDCADLPYFLRAYFSWKLRLPFIYSKCYSQAQGKTPPVCGESRSNLDAAPAGKETLSVVQRFFSRNLADAAQSASGRTAAMDDHTDVYPIRIGADTLRPGVVYIDPYGHVLVVVKRFEQTRTASGILLAVDAQPDNTVAVKRYWRGNFLFVVADDGSAPGFKRFRPVVSEGNSLRTLDNSEILSHPAYGDFSLDQYAGDADAFYDLVDGALSPMRRPARQVLLELVDSLEQQVNQRVESVQSGEDYMRKGTTVPMPSGATIFQTVGPWEDYATPSRDLRMLIAIDVVQGFPDAVMRRPQQFLLDRGRSAASIHRELEDMLADELERRSFTYTRSDGTPWRMKLSELASRTDALEMAYNPNDCVETRWGAPGESVESMPCHRHASAEQLRLMREARDWFHTRTRPAT